jgi:hypothetical protein
LALVRSLLQGDPNILTNYSVSSLVIPPMPFVIGWAIALLGAGIWAVWANRRWMVNITAVFLAIHFYTQWFERLGLAPMSVLVAGLLMLAFALGLWMFNGRFATSNDDASRS